MCKKNVEVMKTRTGLCVIVCVGEINTYTRGLKIKNKQNTKQQYLHMIRKQRLFYTITFLSPFYTLIILYRERPNVPTEETNELLYNTKYYKYVHTRSPLKDFFSF